MATDKIAFYAPLKSPRHQQPSGDRRLARLFYKALLCAGYDVELASSLRAWEGDGDQHRQAVIQKRAHTQANKLIRAYKKRPPRARPKFWFTYHLYHKAPDWIGPAVSSALGIPYIVAEASVAKKQARGKWASGYIATTAALANADLIFNINSNDLAGIKTCVRANKIIKLKPFADINPRVLDANAKVRARKRISLRWGADTKSRWLICVAMMRADVKLESYKVLAAAVKQMKNNDWQLLVVGDGVAAAAVRKLFKSQSGRVLILGRLRSNSVYALMRAGDLFVWPARGEAFGMALLEALGCGLPVVAGDAGGVGDVVYDRITGRLVKQQDARKFAAALEKLIKSRADLEKMAAASLYAYKKSHDIQRAAARIATAIRSLNY